MLLSKYQREEGIREKKGRESESAKTKWRELRVHVRECKESDDENGGIWKKRVYK